jgi:hypothetical protein
VPRATPSDDPPPQPPVRPDLDDCCHSGCTQCVFDLYDDALERYEIALAQWQKRQAQKAQKVRQAATPTPARAKPRSSR